MITDAGADVTSFNVKGQHRFRKGEEISVEYERHSGVNWVSRYEIPSDKYTCIIGNQ